MPDVNDFIAPLAETGDQGLLREALIQRVIYAIADGESAQDLVAVDAGTGAQPAGLGFKGRIFWLDPDDTTTAHDGLSCLVTSDGYRYKAETVIGPRFAVLDNEETDPPGSPSLGDAYLVPSGASGDWSGHPDEIAVHTARGWRFTPPEIGMLVYVEARIGFWHYNQDGDWVAGIGGSALGANSVSPAALLGGRSHWTVVNQTTETPPSEPSDGVTYIIGETPTGDWSGHAGKIAIAFNEEWIILSPQEGWQAYDQSLNVSYIYNGSWILQASGYSSVAYAETLSANTIAGLASSGNGYQFSATTAPTSISHRIVFETLTIDVQADYAGQVFEFEYQGVLTGISWSGSGTSHDHGLSLGLFVDSEASARDWLSYQAASSVSLAEFTGGIVRYAPLVRAILKTSFVDSSVHTIKVALIPFSTGSLSGGGVTLARRRLIARKVA